MANVDDFYKAAQSQLSEMDEADIVDFEWVINDEEFSTDDLVKILIGSDDKMVRDFGWGIQEMSDRESGLDEDDDEWNDFING